MIPCARTEAVMNNSACDTVPFIQNITLHFVQFFAKKTTRFKIQATPFTSSEKKVEEKLLSTCHSLPAKSYKTSSFIVLNFLEDDPENGSESNCI